jgi:DNA/RNA-binding domain of Phe-tRNA-synthetase-like protein
VNRPALSPAPGFVEPHVQAEFPGLRLQWLTVEAQRRASPRALVRRLKELSSRYRGASVIVMRTKAIPQAYRGFFRQIGLDPDVTRIPSEEAAVARLLHGGFRSVDLIADACLVALIETGVPVWALDADLIDERGLGIRTTTAAEHEPSGLGGTYTDPGTLAVVDGSRIHGLLFAEPARGHGVGARTKRVALFAVGVEGVPAIHLEEALWLCADLLS